MKESKLSSGVIFLQKVSNTKVQQARELRKKMTPAEKVLWEKLRGNQILGFKFRRQQIIEGFIVDFFCHQAKTVVEVDGTVHDEPARVREDAHRRRVFESRGLHEMRFRNEDVINNTEKVVTAIAELVQKRNSNI